MQTENIKFREKLGYGVGDLAGSFIWAASGMFLTFFYTDVVGISAAVVGTLLLVARIFDAFVDIGVGALVDKTNSKYGKARPWLLWFAIPYGIAGVLLFSAPDLGPTGSLIYAYATYLLVNVMYSAVNIPYGTLNSLITQNAYQRSLLNIFRMVSALTGTLIVMTMTMPLVQTFGGGKGGWFGTFALFGTLAAFLFLITFRSTKERVKPSVVQKNVPFKKSIKGLFRNKYWLLMVIIMLVFNISSSVGTAVTIYYAQYILQNKDLVGLLGAVSIFPLFIGLLFIAPIIKRFGKRNASIGGLIIVLLGSIFMLINPENLTVIIISLIVKAIGSVPMVSSLFAMLADTIEYGEWKTGMRNEGLVYSAGSFGSKTGSGIGAALVGWLLALGGYLGGQDTISGNASNMIEFLYIYMPIILNAILLLLLIPYKLDEEYPQIIEDLSAARNI
ncbi:MFS transporter [Paenibacillus chitinolyticus]|uniref:Glycoside-pentoside-hexuronide (GPH):cation symporter n=1 Tax=Paenibacillus chitinolyticus TaxID=79263 RepID=A0A410WY42_9BACL|nr:glycoside-pentoside-hexuronide (GPH):cation symporter [Paenibacillus chitinolyticus]MCY9589861.1 glycoside-pentoside-hexuronide (GPH):cation symporter [Paenibacillus chitinolyticus]MCY9598138.1 glycoside-pentoside-hexuronide (GPH):cation symporter [Paenibacillus chitinolyticus]QAV19237.1 MFS transporter [Paenibacillus chitinolyticus]